MGAEKRNCLEYHNVLRKEEDFQVHRPPAVSDPSYKQQFVLFVWC